MNQPRSGGARPHINNHLTTRETLTNMNPTTTNPNMNNPQPQPNLNMHNQQVAATDGGNAPREALIQEIIHWGDAFAQYCEDWPRSQPMSPEGLDYANNLFRALEAYHAQGPS